MDRDRYLTEVPNDLARMHVILPAQHFNPPQTREPEHRLMMAVLDDAVRCVEKYRHPASARDRRLFSEATRWLLIAEPHWPYSFERICEVLGLDASAVRQRLRLAPAQSALSVSGAPRGRKRARC